MENQELVPVLVPRHMVMDVYRWIAGQGQPAEHPAPTVTAAQPMVWPPPRAEADMDWPEAEIAKMVKESPRAMICILRHLADNADTDIPTRDLAKTITHKPDANSSTIAGTLGAYGRRVKNRHKRGWPFSQRWDEGDLCCFYRMPRQVAEMVQRYLPQP